MAFPFGATNTVGSSGGKLWLSRPMGSFHGLDNILPGDYGECRYRFDAPCHEIDGEHQG